MATFKPFKGRTIEPGEKVYVYRNLHNDMWSVRSVKTKLVLGHSEAVTLTDCEFKVSEKGRQKVLRTKEKHIHAGIVGYYGSSNTADVNTLTERLTEITYNPYKYDSFVRVETGESVKESPMVYLDTDRRVYMLEG